MSCEYLENFLANILECNMNPQILQEIMKKLTLEGNSHVSFDQFELVMKFWRRHIQN